ncbi:alpha/beta hydrolase [Pantoea sp.]|uniref:alpha/beta fold hydrolase n=1 Tax=Pantoea sp. TaxID=69393 RepID=UPI0031CF1671
MSIPLVLLGGTLCDAALWQPICRYLPQQSVIIPEMGGAESAEQLAAQLLNNLPPRFLLAGFSLGALVALEMQAQAPQRIAGLALMAVNPLADAPTNAAGRIALLAKAEESGMTPVIEQLWPRYVHASRLADSGLFHTLCKMATRNSMERFRQQTAIAIQRRDLRHTLPALHAPLLILNGDSDAICTPKHQRLLTDAAPAARHITLEQCGHFLPLEQPQACASALQTWIKESEQCVSTH